MQTHTHTQTHVNIYSAMRRVPSKPLEHLHQRPPIFVYTHTQTRTHAETQRTSIRVGVSVLTTTNALHNLLEGALQRLHLGAQRYVFLLHLLECRVKVAAALPVAAARAPHAARPCAHIPIVCVLACPAGAILFPGSMLAVGRKRQR